MAFSIQDLYSQYSAMAPSVLKQQGPLSLFAQTPPAATATTPTTGTATGTPGTTGYSYGGGPTFTPPTAAALAQDQNTYKTATLGGYAGLNQVNDMLGGNLARGTVAMLNQAGAERGVAGGIAGSPNANAAYLRALGLTSEGQVEKGLSALNAAYATTPQLNPLGISGQNLEAWRTVTGETAQAQLQAARDANAANLAIRLREIDANTSMTMEAKREAYATAQANAARADRQAESAAYAKMMNAYFSSQKTPTPTTTATTMSPPAQTGMSNDEWFNQAWGSVDELGY